KKIRRQIDDGLEVIDTGLKVAPLFERWHDDILRHQVGLAASSNYKSVADHHIVPTLGNKKVVDLRVTDVDRLLSKKLDGGLSVSTVRRIRSVFAQCLDQGIRWGIVNRNVATLSRAPREARKEGRTLTPDQARQLIEYLEGKRNEALWILMLSTGLRRGEALGL
ncbi:phage integrase, partial [mine drainage metagenome]